MALHKHEPVSERMMLRQWRECSICQLLRKIYHLTDDPEIKLELRVAVAMAKSMDKKLRSYNGGWDKKFWGPNDSRKP